ncbi:MULTISPECIES: hypothetical protein [Chryseobacterium]|uniref:hypothetical protein n=1 Tax=Chryseobacterium TaxID=59732 RepID=UPI000C9E0CB3|nr:MULTISPECIES: hypothetical protein [Chryseobacterium]VXB60625.1 conserved membrane hypothetical protein [Chryseobacterium sp. 8AT]
MKKKVFKYKFVYWISIVINLIVLILYWNYSYSIFLNSSFEIKDLFSISLIFLTALYSVLTLVFLLIKQRFAVLLYSIFLILIFIMFLKTIIEAISDERKGINGTEPIDYLISSVVYLLFFGTIFFLIQKYKFKNTSDYLEIDEIGKLE